MDSYYRGKRVFVTGHNGFKGSWLTWVLLNLGATVKGYSLAPINCSLYNLSQLDQYCEAVISDIRDKETLRQEVISFNPDIIIHLAAQPLVIESYQDPVYTYETNVLGTVNLLEAARGCSNLQSIVNVTTDKVYENKEQVEGYQENDRLNGYDPYSNSKSCSELVTDCYRKSFFNKLGIPISTIRAGNVIGGGDFSDNRIVPDCYRAFAHNEKLKIRNPNSIRPYQHVLEPVIAYMYVAERQVSNLTAAGSYNVGPLDSDCVKTIDIVKLYQQFCGSLDYEIKNTSEFHEAMLLKLDCSKIRSSLNWKPLWNIEIAMQKTTELYNSINASENPTVILYSQIREYLNLFKEKII